MSRGGNCYDDAVAESFFSSSKKERIRGKTYLTRDEARADILANIEGFYNRKRRHPRLELLSPDDLEELEVGVGLSTNSGKVQADELRERHFAFHPCRGR